MIRLTTIEEGTSVYIDPQQITAVTSRREYKTVVGNCGVKVTPTHTVVYCKDVIFRVTETVEEILKRRIENEENA